MTRLFRPLPAAVTGVVVAAGVAEHPRPGVTGSHLAVLVGLVVLTKTSITLKTGASLNGRLLAQTAVSIGGSTIVEPAP